MRPPPSRRGLLRALATGMFVAAAEGCVLARPAPAFVGSAPSSLGARNVSFPSASGSVIHAWLAPGKPGGGAVLLLHGMGGNRSDMLGRARFLHRAGFTVLAPDFQAHGESAGRYITFGELESLDARAALAFLRAAAPGERVGIIGVSMGGAASLVGAVPVDADALVLESVYPTFRDAVSDRLHVWLGPLGFLGGAVTPALIQLVTPRIGVDADSLRPIDAIGRVNEPVLVIGGTEDGYTPLDETRALFDHAPQPKELWEVAGAGHEDLHAFAPREYERRVGEFLSAYLRGTPPSSHTATSLGAPGDSAIACVGAESASRRECP